MLRVNGTLSKEFVVKVGVHQGLIPSPLLFIVVLEALLGEFRSGCPQELLYTNNLVLIAEGMEELIKKFKKWSEGMEIKGLQTNMKTKIMESDCNTGSVRTSGRWHCSLCKKGFVATLSSVFSVNIGVHKRCSG